MSSARSKHRNFGLRRRFSTKRRLNPCAKQNLISGCSRRCAQRGFWVGVGDDAWNFLTTMAVNNVFHTSLVPSHYDHLQVFNVDASGGIPSVIYNCLVFSQPGQLDLLPALPAALPVGSFDGSLARGQIKIDKLAWDMKAGTVTAKLTSVVAQKMNIGLPPGVANGGMTLNGVAQKITDLGAGKRGCTVTLPAGESMVLAKFDPIAQPAPRVAASPQLLSKGRDGHGFVGQVG